MLAILYLKWWCNRKSQSNVRLPSSKSISDITVKPQALFYYCTYRNFTVFCSKYNFKSSKCSQLLRRCLFNRLSQSNVRLPISRSISDITVKPHQGRQIRGFKIFLWDSTNNICLYCRLFKKTIFIVIIFLIRCPFRH